MPGELRRRHADTAGRGMDQYRFPAPQSPEIEQAVVGGEEHHRHGCGAGEGPALRYPGDCTAIGDGGRAERAPEDPHHPVPGHQVVHPRAHLDDGPGALAAEALLFGVGVQAECGDDVMEVQPGGAHRDPYLALAQWGLGLGSGLRRDVLRGAPAVGGEPPGGAVRQGQRAVRPPTADQSRQQRQAGPQRQLGFPGGERPGQGVRRLAGPGRVDEDEAARVLGPRAAHQAPQGGLGGIHGPVGRSRTDRVPGEQGQPGRGEPLVGQPPLYEGEALVCGGADPVGGVGQVGGGDGRHDHFGKGGARSEGGPQGVEVLPGHRAGDGPAEGTPGGRGTVGRAGDRGPVEAVQQVGVGGRGERPALGRRPQQQGLHSEHLPAGQVVGVQGHGVRRVGGEPYAQRGGPGDPAAHTVPAEGQPGPAVLVGQQCGDLEGRVQQRGVQRASGGVGVLRLRQHHLGEHLSATEPRGTDATEGGAVVVPGLGEALVEVAGVHGFGTGRRPAQQTGRGPGRIPG